MTRGPLMIELDQISFGWPDAPPVQRDLTLGIGAGEKLVLLGANGSGKSTLLQLLAALVFARTGQYRYGGQLVTEAGARRGDWARRFRRQVGIVFQHPEAMLFNATVRDEIAYGPRRLAQADAVERAEHWALQLGLGALLDRPPHSLSGGEKQKLALACVLVLEPALLLLDEPAANLDPKTAGWLSEHLLDTPATVVMSTHNLSMAAEFGDRCVVLEQDAGILFDGALAEATVDVELMVRAGLAWRHRHRHRHRHHPHRAEVAATATSTGDVGLATAVEHAHEHLHWQVPAPRDR